MHTRQANIRSLELIGSIKRSLSGDEEENEPCNADASARRVDHIVDKTPNNPIFNPRYAATPSTRGTTRANRSTGSKSWHITKNSELRELEAQLQTIHTPPAVTKLYTPRMPSRGGRSSIRRKMSYSGTGDGENDTHSGSRFREDPPTASYLTIHRVRPKGQRKKGGKSSGNSSNLPSRFAEEFRKEQTEAVKVNKLDQTERKRRRISETTGKIDRSQQALDAHLQRMRKAHDKRTR